MREKEKKIATFGLWMEKEREDRQNLIGSSVLHSQFDLCTTFCIQNNAMNYVKSEDLVFLCIHTKKTTEKREKKWTTIST